jgi:hypothetical protein
MSLKQNFYSNLYVASSGTGCLEHSRIVFIEADRNGTKFWKRQ